MTELVASLDASSIHKNTSRDLLLSHPDDEGDLWSDKCRLLASLSFTVEAPQTS
jgi:hypothetical protein